MPAHASKAAAAVADRILELLNQGELPPWERDWKFATTRAPCNAISERPYRGVNVWLTRLSQEAKQYEDHRWLTFKQAKHAGGSVRKGEKATPIVFWKTVEKADPNTGDPDHFPMGLIYHVFNVAQTENCNLPPLPVELDVPPPDPIAQAEAIIAGMPDPPIF